MKRANDKTEQPPAGFVLVDVVLTTHQALYCEEVERGGKA